MLRIVAISVCVGLVSYYIDVKRRDKGKKTSSTHALRNGFMTMIVLTLLYFLNVYMSTPPIDNAMENINMLAQEIAPVTGSAYVPVATQVPVKVDASVEADSDMLQSMKAALNMSRKPKSFTK